MALSESERAYLRKHVATDDPAVRMAEWRAAGCMDGTDAAVRSRIGTLTERADAIGFMEGLRRRQAILARASEREQSGERAAEETIRREIRMNTLELSDEVLRAEATRIESGDRKSVQGFARLAAQIDAMTGSDAGGGGLNRKEAEERYARARKQASDKFSAQAKDDDGHPVFPGLHSVGEVPNA